MGLFDSLLGLQTSGATQKAAGTANNLVNQTDGVTNGLLTNAATAAKGDVTGYGNGALSSLLSGYNQGTSDLTNYSGQAQGALQNGVNQAVGTVQGSNAAFQPFASSGTAANGMLSNALGLNGASGNAAATSAFQASPGYQYSVDQASDAAARKAASLGMAASGNTLSAIGTLSSNLANQQYGSFLDRLQGLSSQGLSAVGSISNNNALAGGYQYGGGGALASLLNNTGTNLASADRSLGTTQAGLQTGMGSSLAGIETNLGNSLTNNSWNATNAVNGNSLTAARAQDQTDSNNNSIFGSLLSAGTNLLGGTASGKALKGAFTKL